MGLSYRDSGVDIERGEAFVDAVRARLSKDEQRNIGLFGGLYELPSAEYSRPVLVGSTDGVGTKLLLAKQAGRYDTIGIDLVAMCVNDIVTCGAKPLFFLDYVATSELEIDKGLQVLDGIIKGCSEAGCTLLGGETAEMPGVYAKGDYELAGFAVGIVEKKRIIDGSRIRRGDVLIGVESSGVHANGLSLARTVFETGCIDLGNTPSPLERPLIDELLIPTKIYVSTVLSLIDRFQIRGIAHITGGGLQANVKRVLPKGLDIHIRWDTVQPQPIFGLIQRAGGVETVEMRKTFNLGIGLAVVVSGERVQEVVSFLTGCGEHARVIGEVIPEQRGRGSNG